MTYSTPSMLAAFAFAALGLTGCADTNAPSKPASTAPAASIGAPTSAEQACLAAVSRTANNGDVVLLGSEFSQAGTMVRVGVGPNRAPWQCIAYADGSTAGVQFMGDDSAGVASAPGDASDIYDFVGAKGGQAEGGLQARGYELARTKGLTAYWYNASRRACAEIVTAEGRYSSVTTVPNSECAK